MPAVYLHEVTVLKDHIDRQGHVNNLVYLRWMQDAAVAHSAVQGWAAERYEAAGFGWVAKSHYIEYAKPAFEGDEILVHTWVADFKRASSMRRYRMMRAADGAVLATAETNWAFVNLVSRSPMRIPPDVLECFTVVDAPQPL